MKNLRGLLFCKMFDNSAFRVCRKLRASFTSTEALLEFYKSYGLLRIKLTNHLKEHNEQEITKCQNIVRNSLNKNSYLTGRDNSPKLHCICK